MDSKKVIDRDNQYVLHTYGRSPVALSSGFGMYAKDADDKSYLDFTSGIGVNSLGYCNYDWAEAVSKQAHRLQHTSNLYYTSPCGKLAKRLCKRTGMDKVFFANSGAEANEGAIKCARKYSFDHYGAERSTVITLVNSFHGRTLATLTATGQDCFHQYFGPFNEGFRYVPAGDLEAFKAAADKTVCAVMLELVQGEGGVVALEPGYVHSLVEFCREKDILILVDEVQTGVGRTGTFLCCEHYGFTPDIVTLAKGLGGGLPIGAVLVSKQAAGGMGPGTHGSTFGGNPVVCAGANAVLDQFDDSFMENVNDRAVQLRKGLETLPHVKEVSGIGLMVGIAFDDPRITPADVRARCEEKGLLVLTAKTRLRLLPPLILTEIDVTAALGILKEVLGSYELSQNSEPQPSQNA
jgi:acetylornithine/N-succinyldiaminopimelate aminotransferase